MVSALRTSDHEIPGSIPTLDGIQVMTVRRMLHRAFHFNPSIFSLRQPVVVWRPLKGNANNAHRNQTPQNAASHQGLQRLQIV